MTTQNIDTTTPAARAVQAATVVHVEKMPEGANVVVGLVASEPVTLEPDWREHPEHLAWQQRRDDRNDWISRVIA